MPNLDSQLEKIPSCVLDAKNFSEVVHLNLLTSKPFIILNSEVTAKSFPRKFKKFCDEVKVDDTLIFFMLAMDAITEIHLTYPHLIAKTKRCQSKKLGPIFYYLV